MAPTRFQSRGKDRTGQREQRLKIRVQLVNAIVTRGDVTQEHIMEEFETDDFIAAEAEEILDSISGMLEADDVELWEIR